MPRAESNVLRIHFTEYNKMHNDYSNEYSYNYENFKAVQTVRVTVWMIPSLYAMLKGGAFRRPIVVTSPVLLYALSSRVFPKARSVSCPVGSFNSSEFLCNNLCIYIYIYLLTSLSRWRASRLLLVSSCRVLSRCSSLCRLLAC